MTEYYVSGCIDNGSETTTCPDSEAQFWTLYERKESGLSHALLDCTDRLSAEAAIAVYKERDQLKECKENRRITACVDAFDGIPTERIEGKDLGQILAGEVRLNGAGPRADGGFGFEFSGGVCQLMAEAYAEQFRQSGAINYLELLFNHTDIGPLTITMQRVEGLTPAYKLAQAEGERDQLQEQVKALSAENVSLLNYINDECYVENMRTGVYKCAGHNKPTTPTTDAIVAEMKARGATAVRDALVLAEDGSDIYATASGVIDQLRKQGGE